MNNTVSVIIPCYNGERFIDNSIRSVYEQDYPNIELIVVDDGSTDHSAERIQSWAQRFEQKGYALKYVWQKNRGPGGAIDTGLKYVTGIYLTLLDADDVYLAGSIRKKAEFLDANPDYAGVRNNGIIVKGNYQRLFISADEEKRITDIFSALCDDKTNNWAGTYMIRTALLFSHYPDRNIDPSRFGQNFQIILPVAYRRKFGYIDEPLMEYRIQAESHSQSRDPISQYQKSLANIAGWRDIFQGIVQWLVTDEQERVKYLARYEAASQRDSMHQAAMAGMRKEMRKHYALLRQTGLATVDDRIFYAKKVFSPLVFPLRLVRKIKTLFSKK